MLSGWHFAFFFHLIQMKKPTFNSTLFETVQYTHAVSIESCTVLHFLYIVLCTFVYSCVRVKQLESIL